MTRETKAPPPREVEAPKGPDPAHLAKVAELVKQIEELEAKGEFKDALWTVKQLATLEPGDARVGVFRPRLEEKLRRLEAWQGAQRRAEGDRKDALRSNTIADWQKV